jgi:hypothetical protein
MPQIQADLFFAEKIIARTVFNFTYQLALRPSLPCVYPKRENGEFQDHGRIFHELRCAGDRCCWRCLFCHIPTPAFRQRLWQVARRQSKSSGFYELKAMSDRHRIESAINDHFDAGDEGSGFGGGEQ